MKKNLIRLFWSLFGYLCIVEGFKKNGVEEVYHWREVIYEDLPLADDTLIGPYLYNIPANNDVNGVEYHVQSGLMITTVGRIRPGVPSTLNAFCVSDYDEGTSPHLWGFPNYEKNTLKASFYEGGQGRKLQTRKKDKYSAGYFHYFYGVNYGLNSGIYNVYNPLEDFTIINTYFPNVDEHCNRLFVLDTGFLHYSTTVSYDVQNPALIIFQLPSNACERRQFPLIRRIEIPNHLWTLSVSFDFVTVDYQPKGSCDDVFLYISNIFDNSIIVYDYKRGDFWSFADASMKPIIAESSIILKSHYYQIPLGIVNLALGYPDKDGNRNAYYGPASGNAEYVVSTKLLKNSKKSPNKYNPEEFSLIGYRGCISESYKQIFDPDTGVIFFAEMQSKRIRCWNTKLPLNSDTMGVVFESDSLLFPCDIYLDFTGYLFILGNNLPQMFLSEEPLNITDINSRVFRVKASEAIKGTVCDTSSNFRANYFSYHQDYRQFIESIYK